MLVLFGFWVGLMPLGKTICLAFVKLFVEWNCPVSSLRSRAWPAERAIVFVGDNKSFFFHFYPQPELYQHPPDMHQQHKHFWGKYVFVHFNITTSFIPQTNYHSFLCLVERFKSSITETLILSRTILAISSSKSNPSGNTRCSFAGRAFQKSILL